MPGLELWGHTWRWASDDLPFVSGLSALLYLTWVALLLVYSADLDRTVPSECATTQYSALLSLLGGTMGLQFLNSTAMFFVCLRGSVWETDKRRGVKWLLPMDWALWLVIFALTVWGTQLIATQSPGCLSSRDDNSIRVDPSNIVTVIIIYCWVVLALQIVVWSVTYRVFPKLDDTHDIIKRKEYFDRLMCGCLSSIFHGSDEPQTGDNDMHVVLSVEETSVEEALIEFIGKANMTFSDVVCATLLVAYHQSNQRRHRVEVIQQSSSNLDEASSNLDTDAAERGEARSSDAFLTPPGVPHSLRLLSGRNALVRQYEKVEAETIVEAAHYAKFAVAAYGAKLYMYASKIGCCGGALHLCGLSAMRKMRSLKQRDVEEQRGEGKSIDFLEKEAILKYSQISEQDLVYVSQLNQAKGMLPYFIALDQESQSVVLCIRGTMSLSDCLTDALFNPVSIRDWLRSESEAEAEHQPDAESSQSETKGPYAHNGILKAARALLADLEEHRLLESLLHDRASFAFYRDASVAEGLSLADQRSSSEPLPHGGSQVGQARDRSGLGDTLSVDCTSTQPAGPLSGTDASTRRFQNPKFKGTIYTRYGSSGAIDTEKQPGSPTLKRHESASMRRLGSFMSRAGGRTPRRRVSLAKMANFAERMAQRRWRLVVTGHSLGAGVASLIALKLNPRFPNLHCWAYASPGGLMSRALAETMTDYCTAVAIGKDWVPRATLANAHRLRDELMLASTHCRLPKVAIFWGGMCGCFDTRKKGNMFYPSENLPEQPKKVWELYCRDTQDARMPALEPGMDFIAPGRVIFFRPEKDDKRPNERTALSPVWLPPGELQAEGLLVSKRCVADHMPHFVLAVIKRTARRMAAEEHLFDAPLGDPVVSGEVPSASEIASTSEVGSRASSKPASTLLTSWLSASLRRPSTLSAPSLSMSAPTTTRSSARPEPARDVISEPLSPKAARDDEVVIDVPHHSSPFAAYSGGHSTTAEATSSTAVEVDSKDAETIGGGRSRAADEEG